ncbi:MAG: choline dehydrogenase [Pseudomonadota bacterium]
MSIDQMVQAMSGNSIEADYVIIGAGSAGSVLAERLSANGRNQVIVLEYGGSDLSPFIQMPGALSYPMNMARYDWGYQASNDPGVAGRRLACPRGKVVGGSSSINGMIYVRGHGSDYDRWEEMGAAGWGWQHVLPYFKAIETAHDVECKSDAGDAAKGLAWRGKHGPLHITRGRLANPLFHAFLKAGQQAGYPLTHDYNGYQQEGICVFDRTIWRGRRWSAADAWLHPATKRANLRLLSHSWCQRILFENHRAIGIEAVGKDGKLFCIHAAREVIIAAGAIGAPLLLMRSGIGPADDLRLRGITMVQDRPGVGCNLHDHLELYLQIRASQPVSLAPWLGLLPKALAGAWWMIARGGPAASNQFEAGAFIRSRAGISAPDIQIHFLPVAVRYDGKAPERGHGFQMHVGPMHPRSRGVIRLGESCEAPPVIEFRYLSEPGDLADFRRSVQLAREILRQDAFQPYYGGEIAPGEMVDGDRLDDYIRSHSESAYHPCGTCRMGDRQDSNAVVDPECRVIGVDGLRIADSSIFPHITNGNTNAPSIMVGRKAAAHILGETLPADPGGYWVPSNWKTSQH